MVRFDLCYTDTLLMLATFESLPSPTMSTLESLDASKESHYPPVIEFGSMTVSREYQANPDMLAPFIEDLANTKGVLEQVHNT